MPVYRRETVDRKTGEALLQQEIGQRIAWARELAKLSQTKFAAMIGTTPQILNKTERGNQPPSIFMLIECAAKLQVTLDYLLTGRMRPVPMDFYKELQLVDGRKELLRLQLMGTAPTREDEGGDR